VLSVKGLSKSFGALQALKDVSFEVAQGRVHGIIGPNGAGKTTLFNCISGHLAADCGTVEVDGRKISGYRPDLIANLGVRRTFQAGKLVSNLTVLENVMAGQFRFGLPEFKDTFLRLPFLGSRTEDAVKQDALKALALVGMEGTRTAGPWIWFGPSASLCRSRGLWCPNPSWCCWMSPTAHGDPGNRTGGGSD
jgi:ABC-type branched-subunit amino acid transport system ATPase component